MPELPEVETVANGVHAPHPRPDNRRRLDQQQAPDLQVSARRDRRNPHRQPHRPCPPRRQDHRRRPKPQGSDPQEKARPVPHPPRHDRPPPRLHPRHPDPAPHPRHPHPQQRQRAPLRRPPPLRPPLRVAPDTNYEGPGPNPSPSRSKTSSPSSATARPPSRPRSSTSRSSTASATSTPTKPSSTPASAPRRHAGRLTRAELTRLRDALIKVLTQAIQLGGSSVSDYVDADGVAGFFQLHHHVYSRTGQPCRICGTPIKRIVIGGRSTHFCPNCQK